VRRRTGLEKVYQRQRPQAGACASGGQRRVADFVVLLVLGAQRETARQLVLQACADNGRDLPVAIGQFAATHHGREVAAVRTHPGVAEPDLAEAGKTSLAEGDRADTSKLHRVDLVIEPGTATAARIGNGIAAEIVIAAFDGQPRQQAIAGKELECRIAVVERGGRAADVEIAGLEAEARLAHSEAGIPAGCRRRLRERRTGAGKGARDTDGKRQGEPCGGQARPCPEGRLAAGLCSGALRHGGNSIRSIPDRMIPIAVPEPK
jgi:hypothetical protein